LAVACGAIALSGCAPMKTAGDIIRAVSPTLREQCQQQRGQYSVITTYGPNGNPREHQECMTQ
jgi:hypothetical protein